jgi:hypothetical protein
MDEAKKYFETQLSNPEFRKHFIEEKIRLDIEYELDELEHDIIEDKSPDTLLTKIKHIKKLLNIAM